MRKLSLALYLVFACFVSHAAIAPSHYGEIPIEAKGRVMPAGQLQRLTGGVTFDELSELAVVPVPQHGSDIGWISTSEAEQFPLTDDALDKALVHWQAMKAAAEEDDRKAFATSKNEWLKFVRNRKEREPRVQRCSLEWKLARSHWMIGLGIAYVLVGLIFCRAPKWARMVYGLLVMIHAGLFALVVLLSSGWPVDYGPHVMAGTVFFAAFLLLWAKEPSSCSWVRSYIVLGGLLVAADRWMSIVPSDPYAVVSVFEGPNLWLWGQALFMQLSVALTGLVGLRYLFARSRGLQVAALWWALLVGSLSALCAVIHVDQYQALTAGAILGAFRLPLVVGAILALGLKPSQE